MVCDLTSRADQTDRSYFLLVYLKKILSNIKRYPDKFWNWGMSEKTPGQLVRLLKCGIINNCLKWCMSSSVTGQKLG